MNEKVDYKEMSDEVCGTCRKTRIKVNVARRIRRRPLECYKCSRSKVRKHRRAS